MARVEQEDAQFFWRVLAGPETPFDQQKFDKLRSSLSRDALEEIRMAAFSFNRATEKERLEEQKKSGSSQDTERTSK
jgi:hypothetical protein